MIVFNRLSNFRLHSVVAPFVFLLGSLCLPVLAQTASVERYKVPSVYLPEIVRPPIKVNSRALERFGTGVLPKRDGEPFQVTFKETVSAKDFDQAKVRVYVLFEKIDLQADLSSIHPVDKVRTNAGLREDKRLESFQKPYENDFDAALNEKVGKLNEQASAEARKTADEMKKLAQRKSTVFAFRQQYKDVPLENSGLLYVDRENGLSSISGNVFSKINLTNQYVLKESDAVSAGASHIKQFTKVKSALESVKPSMVIVPYADGFKYAWKMSMEAEDGPYMLWVDAENGKVLQLLPQFFFDSARGLVFTPAPDSGTTEMNFEVDPPVGGNYRLKLTGQLEVHNNGADGVTSTDLTIPDAHTGEANFNVSPLNGTAVERTSTPGYNSRFQEINVFAWLYHVRNLAVGWGIQVPLPAFTARVNTPGNNAWSNGSFELGSATTNTSTACGDLFNSANDATIFTHEYGHNINGIQYAGVLSGSINEGLSDFWADTIHNTDTFGGWWAHNCPTPVQTGFVPRQSEALDVFPEHRTSGGYNKEIHADGQMISWALWNVRREYQELSSSGVQLINTGLMSAMTTAGVGIIDGISDKRVHDSFVDLERQLVINNGTDWRTIKILSGFAHAGLFLSDREAIIDIDDDYLNRNSATPPVFNLWTGRDYTFDATGNAITTGTLPFNTRYRVEVANDAGFTTNFFSSGWQTGVTASAGGTATWPLPVAMWDTLKTGNKLFYRVQTTDAVGGNIRNSHTTGDTTVSNMNVPYAVINDSGEPPVSICGISMSFCNICKIRPHVCYPIYDPWWKFKCPNCMIDILVDLDERIRYVTVFDSNGRKIGVLNRLKKPVVINGVRYTHDIAVKARKGVSYVLKAETAKGTRLDGKFKPAYTLREVRGKVLKAK